MAQNPADKSLDAMEKNYRTALLFLLL